MIDTRIQRVRDLIESRDTQGISLLSKNMHASTWVDMAHHLDDDEIVQLLDLMPRDIAVEFMAELAPGDAARVIALAPGGRAASLVLDIEPDDAADILQSLDLSQADQILARMESADSAPIRKLLLYEEGTAGGLMTPEFVAIQPGLRADQAIDALRELASEAELANYVYVLDRDDHLLGVLSLRNLLLSAPTSLVSEAMVSPVVSVLDTDNEATAANLLRDRNLLALPVTDADGRLLGVITHDDAVDVIESELVDDYMKMAGTDAEEMERKTPIQIARLRVPWLLGTMVIELGAGLVIHRFDGVLQRVILLASFMPVISAVSGNVGLQSAAIVVRGLDTGQVALAEWKRHLRREMATTSIMAVICGVFLGVIGMVWSQHAAFSLVIGGALTCSMMTAGVMGSIIPMVSKKMGFDPAATAGPFETAFQDVIGFAVFLWLASLLVNFID